MKIDPRPTVLLMVDRDSRLRILQDSGARIVFVDWRLYDPVARPHEYPDLVILPEMNQPIEILAAIDKLPILSVDYDDVYKSAQETLRRIRDGDVIIAKGPHEE